MIQQKVPKEPRLRIAFMGSPNFAVLSLASIVGAGYEVVRVYSQPPRRAGRGQKETRSPVHQFALEKGLKVCIPRTLENAAELKKFNALALDVAVVSAYGLILPSQMLDIPTFGCINIHASLLPRWRGAAPIQRAIQFGDKETGISIMKMTEKLDAGPVFSSAIEGITMETTTENLERKLAYLGGKTLLNVLEKLKKGNASLKPQSKDGVTYARKVLKSEARINWSIHAIEIERLVRALCPWPGAWFELNGERIKILAAKVEKSEGPIGQVLDNRLLVACGEGAIRIRKLQRSGKRALSADEFLRGKSVEKGTTLT